MANPFDDSNNYGSKQAQLESVRNKTIESQKNALRSIANSEQIGVSTVNELMDQGEKLDRTNQRLDEISEKQKISEKHIGQLKTGFIGGIFGLFKKKEAPLQNESKKDKVYDTYRDAHLTQIVDNYKPPPTMNDTVSSNNAASSNNTSSAYQDQFDKNLDDMSHGVKRLNNLAKGMGGELDRQNELLAVMAPKTDKINSTMANQNKQLNVLLYGKPK